MCLSILKAWFIGFLIVISSIFMGEIALIFNESFFKVTGFNRNFYFIFLWCLFSLGAFVSSYYAKQYGVLIGLSFILVIPAIAALTHYIVGSTGAVIDFSGESGIVTVLKIYFFGSMLFVVFGSFFGYFLSKEK